jgi:hypothetical protein
MSDRVASGAFVLSILLAGAAFGVWICSLVVGA